MFCVASWNSSNRTRSLLLNQVIVELFFKCDVVTSTVCRDPEPMFRELSRQKASFLLISAVLRTALKAATALRQPIIFVQLLQWFSY